MKKKSLSLLIAVAMATTMVPSTMAFADTTAPVEDTQEPTVVTKAPASTYEVDYSTHVQNIGWQKAVKTVGDEADLEDVTMAGTEGKGLRLEAIKISGANLPKGASITYKAHSQNKGWMDAVTTEAGTPVDEAEMAGTKGEGLRLEALRLTLNGMPGYALKVSVHVQNKGWMKAVTIKNGSDLDKTDIVGTEGEGLRLEGIKIQIVKTDEEKKLEVAAINAVAKAEATKTAEDIEAAKTAVEAVNDATVKAEQTAKIEAITGEDPDQPEVTELKVESVKGINEDYLTVAITAPTEDILGQIVEVKNSAGEIVEVKPLDIAAGDETANFKFVKSVDKADLKGVWTVNGVECDLDVYNKLSAFLEAKDQIELKNALVDLGIENVNIDNMKKYYEAKGEITKSVDELTVEDVQKLVDDVNASSISAEEEKAIVKAVTDAVDADNEVALLTALQNEAFVKVNPDWITVATDGYKDKLIGNESTIAEVQEVINTANDAILNNVVEKNGIDKDKLTSSKELIEKWASVDKDGKIKDSTLKDYPKLIDIQLAVADVVGATTPTTLKNKLTVLAELTKDDMPKIDMDKYVDANGKAYIAKLSQTISTDKDEVGEIDKIIGEVNKAESTALVKAVNTSAQAIVNAAESSTEAQKNALIKALNNLGIKQVAKSNINQYVVDASSFVSASEGNNTKDDVQKQVDNSNVTAITSAIDADKLIEALKVLELKNIVENNKDAYLTDVTGNKATIKDDAATIDNALKDINCKVVVDAQVKAINEAKTSSEVKVALDALANVDRVNGYLNVKSVDRDFVASYVLSERAEQPEEKYANVEKVEEIVTEAIKARTEELDGINEIALQTPLNKIVIALDKLLDEDFSKLSNMEKYEKAQAFQDKLTFKEDGTLKTPFVTLAEVKALLK